MYLIKKVKLEDKKVEKIYCYLTAKSLTIKKTLIVLARKLEFSRKKDIYKMLKIKE